MNALTNNKRIAKNTLLLYLRMIFLILVQLYTVPIILKALGVVDYGIYNVVGGVVTMFSFIGGSLASGSQRFMAFALGRNDENELEMTFKTTVTIYLFFAIISFLLLECIGIWFLNTQMNIPVERIYAANWVLQFSLFAFILNLISIPYNAAIIAHEKMSVFAYVSVVECLLKLLAAIAISTILSDRLIMYALFICIIAISVRVIYQVYCVKTFVECKNFKICWDFQVGRELLIYSGWNAVGSIALLSRQQGLNIILNLFFGPLLNAAHSIALQINGALTQFVNNVYMATRPQITKLYAANNLPEMWNLVFQSSRFAFYLLIYLTIPALLEMKTILTFWLGNVPHYTVCMSKLMIVSILVESLVNQIIAVYQASNKIRSYQLYSSTIILLNIPLSYILLKNDLEHPMLPYLISVGLSIIYVLSILLNAKKQIRLNLFEYCTNVILKVFVIFMFSIFSVAGVMMLFNPSLLRVLFTIVNTMLYSSLFIWIIGLNDSERYFIKKIIKQKIFNR